MVRPRVFDAGAALREVAQPSASVPECHAPAVLRGRGCRPFLNRLDIACIGRLKRPMHLSSRDIEVRPQSHCGAQLQLCFCPDLGRSVDRFEEIGRPTGFQASKVPNHEVEPMGWICEDALDFPRPTHRGSLVEADFEPSPGTARRLR